jgi:hypothetical protein
LIVDGATPQVCDPSHQYCGARFSVPLSASADSSAPNGELKFAAAR